MTKSIESIFDKEPTISVSPFEKKKFLIYGPAGVGKSTFFSKFKKHIFLNTDPGLDFIKVRNMPIVSWKSFKKTAEQLIAFQTPGGAEYDKKFDNSIIVIDLIDGLWTLCRKAVLTQAGYSHESDGEWGKGHDLVKKEFQTQIASLAAVYGVGFISHDKNIEIKGRLSRISKTVPSITGNVGKFIEGLCDFIGYCEVSSTKAEKELGDRYITFRPTEELTAKDRAGLFPEKMPLDFDVVYSTYQKNFGRKYNSSSKGEEVVSKKLKFKIK